MSDKIVGVAIFTSAIGLGFRTDKGLAKPTSWKDLADPKLAGARGSYIIPVNSLGQCHLMMLGKIYGKGLQDLDAAYKALEQLKPIKLVDFTGQMEKMLLSGEVSMGVIHDSGVYRYEGQNQPVDFASPSEGVMALEQVLNVTPGSKVKELAFAYIDYMLRPDVQKLLAEGVWYSPANKKVKLDAKYDAKLLTTEAKVATLIQPDWKWYNARKEDIDARVHEDPEGCCHPERSEGSCTRKVPRPSPRDDGAMTSATIQLDDVTKTFDGTRRWPSTASRSTSRPASSSRCWGRRAAARPRRCA